MLEIQHTNFVHGSEVHEPAIDTNAQYTIFEPVVEHRVENGGVVQLNADQVLKQMEGYAHLLIKNTGLLPGLAIDLKTKPLGELIDTDASGMLEDLATIEPYPEALPGILITVAKLAERSGFDRKKSNVDSQLGYADGGRALNLNLHSDGLSEQATEMMAKFGGKIKIARFIYPIGLGTLIYPKAEMEHHFVDDDGNKITSLDYLQSINAPKFATIPEDKRFNVDAQQIRPGRILGFDPTRTFWHQAPPTSRLVLTTDVYQVESKPFK